MRERRAFVGKMKELIIDKQNSFDEHVNKLNENTEELKDMSFENQLDTSDVKDVLSAVLKILKEIKEIILI